MENVLSFEGKPIFMWLDQIEDGALEQAKHLAQLPFTFKHVAIMPDAHLGYGMPIGGILATKNVVIPNAVGVDIGCGVQALRTSLQSISYKDLSLIVEGIKEVIPVGFNHQKSPQLIKYLPEIGNKDSLPIVSQEFESARSQIGTLGGGNHFIELQEDDEDGKIWVMIHSGSRNIGLKVANYYNKLAKYYNKHWYSSVPTEWDLAFLPISSPEGHLYWREMNYCVNFAVMNRDLMMANIKSKIAEIMGDFVCLNVYDIAHNYASFENHFKQNVIVHRKGATRAYNGEVGLIPGSQGTQSYVVRGKGNPMSFKSCSHGAGRKMGRNLARKSLDLKTEQEKLNKRHILHSLNSVKDLDEAPGAYKDIDKVIFNQRDLVEVMTKLKPLAVVKG